MEDYIYLFEDAIIPITSFSQFKDFTPEKLLKWMNEHVEYPSEEKMDKEKDIVYSPEEVLTKGYGTCFEQTWFEKREFDAMGIPCKAYFYWGFDDNDKPVSNFMSHMFLVYREDNKYCMFEHSDYRNRGIHKFNSMNELFKIVSDDVMKHPNKRFKASKIHFFDAIDYQPGKTRWDICKINMNKNYIR